MQSTLNPKQSDDPHEVLVVAPDVVLVVPTDEELSRLAHTMRHPSNPLPRAESDLPAGPTVPPVDTTFRPSADSGVQVPGRGRTIGGRAARAFITPLLLAGCAGAAAITWQSYGDAAKQIVQWAPQRVLALILPLEKPALAAQPTAPAVEAAAADTPPAQPAPSAPATPEAVAPTAAAPIGETAEQLRSMARDLASAGQQIEQLKVSIEELKASQQQMSREMAKAPEPKASEAKAAEQNLRPRLSALPPRPAAARARKPMSSLPPQQAAAYPVVPQAAAPYVPQQIEAPPQATTRTLTDPELASVPRPPMPVR